MDRTGAGEPAYASVQLDHLPATLSILDACAAAMVLVDPTGTIRLVNRTFAELAGSTVEGLLQRSVWDLLPMEVGVAAMSDLRHGSGGGQPVAVPEQVWADALGDRRRIVWSLSVVQDAAGLPSHLLATGMDVTRERTVQAQLRRQAETDPLTGLHNRAAVHDVLASYLDEFRGIGCGLLFCDLDGFKAVNDTHGHAAGDRVLQETARRLLDAVGSHNVVARLGGDEFVVVVPSAGSVQARAVGTRVERAVCRPMRLDGGTVRVGVSVGLRLADPGEDPDTVLHDADATMYARKTRKRAALAR